MLISKRSALPHVEIDLSSTTWFDADMCAPFGAILYRIGQLGNQIHLTNFRPGVEKILSKNGFLSHYGRLLLPDTFGTTIPGGLGLKLLGEFINLNGGRLQIISDAGYWSLEKGH